ncbi:MAG: SWIM zinc finger family protein [Anaerolineaceae bacterium]|jgi:uncharacterized Zn finger protein
MGNDTNGSWGMNPRKARGGIQARSQRGEFGKNWWARRWINAMERLMVGTRLARGQHYARLGQVVSLDEIKGGVRSLVQGTRPKPYKVTIQVTPLNNKQWEKVFDVLADQAVYVAQLLAGEMPEDIEDVFSKAGVSLFPDRAADLITECSCPDKVNPCKHVAATHYILGDRFDEDPFLLFRMRGRTQEQILEALRQRRGADAEAELTEPIEKFETQKVEPVLPLSQQLEHFWEMSQPLEDFAVHVHPPEIPQPLLKRLGEPEVPSQLTLKGQLEESYDAITQLAMLIAYADLGNGAKNGNGDDE